MADDIQQLATLVLPRAGKAILLFRSPARRILALAVCHWPTPPNAAELHRQVREQVQKEYGSVLALILAPVIEAVIKALIDWFLENPIEHSRILKRMPR